MKRFIELIPLLLFTAIMLDACSASRQPARKEKKESNTESKIASRDSLYASIERTPCFGRCPTYKLRIYQSGYATYEGIRFVEKEGIYETHFTKDELKQIADKAKEIGYFDLDDEYDSPVTDFPSTITSLNKGGNKKSIKNRHHGPDILRNYEKFLDELAAGKKWSMVEPGGGGHLWDFDKDTVLRCHYKMLKDVAG